VYRFAPLALILIGAFFLFAVMPERVGGVSGDSWMELASLHEPRGRLGAAVVDGKIYAIGGGYS